MHDLLHFAWHINKRSDLEAGRTDREYATKEIAFIADFLKGANRYAIFRGLPGLWVCMDPNCSEIAEEDRDGICGKMYSQPREYCDCGARVHELYTCRFCGTAAASPPRRRRP